VSGAVAARALAALALLAASAGAARAETPAERGERLRAALGKEPPRDALAGRVALAAHLGLSRVGKLELGTEVVSKGGEKLYELRDSLSIDAKGFGALSMTLTAELGADLSVRELVLYTMAPNPAGGITRRNLRVIPEGDALWVTEAKDDDKPRKWKLEGAPRSALLLTPPLGVGERFARLAPKDAARATLDAWDLASGEKVAFGLALEAPAKLDVRGKELDAQKATREEGKATLDEWLEATTREPLVIEKVRATSGSAAESDEKCVRFVGRESAEKFEDLPAPSADERKKEGPRETVLRFLRASGAGDGAALEPLLDVDALFEAAKPEDRSKEFKATFKKTLIAMLTSDEWRRGESVKLVAGAARVEDLVASVKDDKATVRVQGAPEGAPCFELARSEAGWRITALPRK